MGLNTLSLPELVNLQSAIGPAIRQRQREERSKTLADLHSLAKSRGYTLPELFSRDGKRSKSAPKYANPADPSQTWTGRGRKPAWAAQHLANGGNLQQLQIA